MGKSKEIKNENDLIQQNSGNPNMPTVDTKYLDEQRIEDTVSREEILMNSETSSNEPIDFDSVVKHTSNRLMDIDESIVGEPIQEQPIEVVEELEPQVVEPVEMEIPQPQPIQQPQYTTNAGLTIHSIHEPTPKTMDKKTKKLIAIASGTIVAIVFFIVVLFVLKAAGIIFKPSIEDTYKTMGYNYTNEDVKFTFDNAMDLYFVENENEIFIVDKENENNFIYIVKTNAPTLEEYQQTNYPSVENETKDEYIGKELSIHSLYYDTNDYHIQTKAIEYNGKTMVVVLQTINKEETSTLQTIYDTMMFYSFK